MFGPPTVNLAGDPTGLPTDPCFSPIRSTSRIFIAAIQRAVMRDEDGYKTRLEHSQSRRRRSNRHAGYIQLESSPTHEPTTSKTTRRRLDLQ